MADPPPEAAAAPAVQPPPDITTRGAIVTPEYVERGVKIYGITDVEMDGLNWINAEMAICMALVTFFFGLAIPTATSLLLSPPEGLTQKVLWLLVIFLVLLGVAALVAMKPLYARGKSIKSRIERESRQVAKPNK